MSPSLRLRLRPLTVTCFFLFPVSIATFVAAQQPGLHLRKTVGGSLEAVFEPSPDLPFPSAYNLYRGGLENVSLYEQSAEPGGRCDLPGAVRSVDLPDDLGTPGSFYYLLTASDACGLETDLGTDSEGRPRPNRFSCSGAGTVPVLGGGTHSMDGVVVTEVLTASAGLVRPRDLEFHPGVPGQLWIVNQTDHTMVIVSNAGMPTQTSVKHLGLDNGRHFLAQPSALAFGIGTGALATAQEEDDYTQGPPPTGTPQDFMGPTLWTSDANIFQGGHASHLDMLHNSPNSVGIAWERDNVYWVYDGYHASLTRYDFREDHGLGGTDHRDGVVVRYVQGEVSYTPDVPSHLVYDPTTGYLYAADTGNSRIAVLDTSTGVNTGPTFPNYDGSNQTAVGGASLWTLVEGSCFGMVAPAGLEMHDGMLFVSDYASSNIYAFTLDGRLVDYLETDLPAGTLMGMAFDPRDDSLYLVDAPGNRVLRIEPR